MESLPCLLANRSRCTPEEAFMVWLRRMGLRGTWLEIGKDDNFQATPSRLSLIFNDFSDKLYNRYSKNRCLAEFRLLKCRGLHTLLCAKVESLWIMLLHFFIQRQQKFVGI